MGKDPLLHTIHDAPVPFCTGHGPPRSCAFSPPHFSSWQAPHPGLLAKITCSFFSHQLTISWQVELFVLLQPSRLPYTSEFLNLLCLC